MKKMKLDPFQNDQRFKDIKLYKYSKSTQVNWSRITGEIFLTVAENPEAREKINKCYNIIKNI